MRIPRVMKMVVMAKAGNQPECMAAMPTRTMATAEEKPAHSTHSTDTVSYTHLAGTSSVIPSTAGWLP